MRLSFSIALHEKDISILLAIKEYLGVGSVEISNRNDSGNVYRYIVRNVNDLNNVIRPLILSPNILFRKRLNDTQLFLSALDILLAGTHNTESGLAQIRVLDSQLTGKMNKEEMNALPKSTTVITAE